MLSHDLASSILTRKLRHQARHRARQPQLKSCKELHSQLWLASSRTATRKLNTNGNHFVIGAGHHERGRGSPPIPAVDWLPGLSPRAAKEAKESYRLPHPPVIRHRVLKFHKPAAVQTKVLGRRPAGSWTRLGPGIGNFAPGPGTLHSSCLAEDRTSEAGTSRTTTRSTSAIIGVAKERKSGRTELGAGW